MPDHTYIQPALFPSRADAPSEPARREPPRRRLSYARVTRDPHAALSYAESRIVAAQVTQGFVAAFSRLAPERQAALRAALRRHPSWARSA
jgi:hypothetical protein